MTTKLEAARNRLRNLREKSEDAVAQGVTSLVTVGSAGLMSYLNVKFGDEDQRIKFAGIDADLAAGLGLNALAFAGMFGANSGKSSMATMLLHSMGNGALASYAVFKAAEIADASNTSAGREVPRQMNGTERRTPFRSAFSEARAQGRV